MRNPFLIGERIYLRPLERADAPAIVEFLNDEQVTRTLNMHRPLTLEAEEAWLEKAMKDERNILLAIARKSDDRYLGNTGLHLKQEKDRAAMFGIFIGAKDEWNKGHGTETAKLMLRYGFETLNLNRICLHVYANNPGGIRAYEKAGYVREGIMRQATYSEGRYHDVLVMGVLAEEWFARKERK